jgi:hypothetical protein
MKNFISSQQSKSGLVLRCGMLMGSLLFGAGLILSTPSEASAQAAYGSYIGVGGSVGLSDGGNDDGSSSGGVIAARYRFLRSPISLRGQVLISDSTAFVPTVSYDIPINWQTDFYIGAGAAIQDSEEDSSPVGNQTAFVLQPGIDYSFPYSNLVVFGNAIIAFDAYKDSNDTAASVQAGLGVRF